jgi:hypothetical protein
MARGCHVSIAYGRDLRGWTAVEPLPIGIVAGRVVPCIAVVTAVRVQQRHDIPTLSADQIVAGKEALHEPFGGVGGVGLPGRLTEDRPDGGASCSVTDGEEVDRATLRGVAQHVMLQRRVAGGDIVDEPAMVAIGIWLDVGERRYVAGSRTSAGVG